MLPFYQLGFVGAAAQAVSAVTSTAPKIAPLLSTSAWAGPIGVGIAVLGGLIAGFWSAHNARAKGAKDENAAMNSAVQAFDNSMRAIFDAANSSDPQKYITADQAIQALMQQSQIYWSGMAPYMVGPGRADRSNGGTNCGPLQALQNQGQNQCNKGCTAGCCVGCFDIEPSITDAIAVMQQGGGSVNVRTVYGSKYGGVARAGYTLSYSPHPPSASDSLLSELTGGGGSVGGGASSLLPLAAIAAALLIL